MTERPLLMSAPMVRAILNGSKTQTRRVLKTEPLYDGRFAGKWKLVGKGGREAALCSPMIADLCPYGMPGDRLWVREHWRAPTSCDHLPPRSISDSEPLRFIADETTGPDAGFGKARRAFHMPRWASRITLEITGVRVERLQDICEADARAEGAPPLDPHWPIPADGRGTHASGYRSLWEQINGPESWGANPWVWVVEFTRAA